MQSDVSLSTGSSPLLISFENTANKAMFFTASRNQSVSQFYELEFYETIGSEDARSLNLSQQQAGKLSLSNSLKLLEKVNRFLMKLYSKPIVAQSGTPRLLTLQSRSDQQMSQFEFVMADNHSVKQFQVSETNNNNEIAL